MTLGKSIAICTNNMGMTKTLQKLVGLFLGTWVRRKDDFTCQVQ